MKTSIKILIGAACMVLVVLAWYDLRIRDAYVSGSYKQPFSGFVAQHFNDFDEIDLGSGTAANVMIKPGPFSVSVDPTATGFVRISQSGHVLHIDAAYPAAYYTPRAQYTLRITCPQLKKFIADSKYTSYGKPVTDTLASEDFKWRPSVISGFNADSLSIEEHHAGAVILKGNKLAALNAVLGIGDGSRSDMIIQHSNQLGHVNLNILNKSQLRLECRNIQHLQYQLSDSARLIVNGVAVPQIKNH